VATQTPLPSNADYNGGYLTGVSYPTASDCFAVGIYDANPSNFDAGMLLTLSNGVWTATPAPEFADISCPSASQCVAVGRAGSTHALGVSSAGSWQTVPATLPAGATIIDELGVSYSMELHCTAVGSYTDYLGDQGLLRTGPG
jgi:hypothetical protein